MRTAKELCELGILKNDGYNRDYGSFLGEFGKIIIKVEDGGYQGDTLLVYKNEKNQFGFLSFGWGSCSGCDALQACDTVEDLQELMDHLYNSIIWFDSKDALSTFVKEHDWDSDYCSETVVAEFLNVINMCFKEDLDKIEKYEKCSNIIEIDTKGRPYDIYYNTDRECVTAYIGNLSDILEQESEDEILLIFYLERDNKGDLHLVLEDASGCETLNNNVCHGDFNYEEKIEDGPLHKILESIKNSKQLDEFIIKTLTRFSKEIIEEQNISKKDLEERISIIDENLKVLGALIENQ